MTKPQGVNMKRRLKVSGFGIWEGSEVQGVQTARCSACSKRGFPKIRGTFLGVGIIRILLFKVLYWGPLSSETPLKNGP